MRALNKDETERRIRELDKEINEKQDEKAKLIRTLEDTIGPMEQKANIIAQRFMESGSYDLPEDMQRGRINAWCDNDDTLIEQVWVVLRDRMGDDWGG